MNLRRGFRRVTFILVIVAAVSGAIIAVQVTIDKHESAKRKLDLPEFDARLIEIDNSGNPIPSLELMANIKKEAWNKMSDDEQIALIKVDKEAKRKKLEERFWVKLPMWGFVGLCILAGLGGAAAGYFGTWLVVWFGGLAIYKLIRWIVLGFRNDTG